MEKKFAIIDLGSNSVRMIIMKVYQDKSYKMIDQVKEMVRLSEGMGQENTLKPIAIKRTVHTLKLFRKLIEVHHVDEVFAIATAAVRKAKNQQFFLDKVEMETGFHFQVISGEEEGYYDYLGVINTIDVTDCVMIDTGGASTELVLVKNRQMKEVVSLPYGAVVLTEQFSKSQEDMNNSIEKFIRKQFEEIKWLKKGEKLSVVGLGGSIRTLAKVHKKKNDFPLEGLHNYEMNSESVQDIYQQIVSTDIGERKNIAGVAKSRSDIIGAGLVPIKVLMEVLQSPRLIISGNGLREGVFLKNYLKSYTQEDEKLPVLEHSLENILKNYENNVEHSYHVQKLAVSIFDQLQELHGMGEKEKKILRAGALLHDIGMYVDYYNHHKHGFYLVMSSRINGLTNRELVMCAFIVGMHRITDFKQDWKEFDRIINKNDYENIKKLALLVRIAEKLDRSEYGSVEEIRCYITANSIQMMLKTNNTPELEIAAAMKSEKSFEKLFDKKLYIV